MAFQTSTSSSPQDLLDKLVTFATAQGWTITSVVGYRDGITYDQVSMTDGSASQNPYFHFLADDDLNTAAINCQPSRLYVDTETPFYAHTGSPNTGGGPGTYISIGHRASADNQGFGGASTAYWFFAGTTSDGRYMHVVVEGDAGVFFHLAFGTIEKAGTFNGGAYMTAMQTDDSSQVMWPFTFSPGNWHSTQWLRCDNVLTGGTVTTDGGTSRWTEHFGQAFAGNTSLSHAWAFGGVIPWNQRTPFGPNLCLTWEDTVPSPTLDDFVILGHTPDIRIVSMDGREPGEIVTIGSDDWYLFPVHVKNAARGGATGSSASYINSFTAGSPPNNDSNLAGFAYRRV
jgi:hypothetical protein